MGGSARDRSPERFSAVRHSRAALEPRSFGIEEVREMHTGDTEEFGSPTPGGAAE
ncbi:hypothetical protein [Nocardia thraciensis]